jgi:DNA-binding GntR family transcriptional regulator
MAPRTKDLSQKVYTHLRQAIVSSELLPGYKLSHQALAQRLGVSHTPLREAFNKLSQEGYVQHIQNRGYFVSDFSRQEVDELLEIREGLEIHALRPAVDRLNENSLRTLRARQESYRKAVGQGSAPDRLRCDRAFHLTLAGFSENQTLTQMLGQVFDRTNLKRRIQGLSPQRGVDALAEHEAILSALEVRDFQKARSTLQRHLKNNKESVLNRMKEDTSSLRKIR